VQYFQAVQQGKQRAGKSQMKMFEVAGFGMLTLTTKKIDGKFHPVGEEEFTAVINSPDERPYQYTKNSEKQEFQNILKRRFKFGLKQDLLFKMI